MEPIKERLGIKGHIKIIELDHDMSDEELRYWLEPETELGPDGLYRIKRPARMSEEEKERRTVLRAENLITNSGMSQLLNNMAVTGQGNMQCFAQIFAVGNGAISGVTRGDTSIAGDGFATNSRKVPASFSSVGFLTIITSNFASGDAVGTWTNCGLVGFKPSGSQNATTTANTGQVNTHLLFNFVKGSSTYAVAYTLSVSN
jgi:hypothetical protein